MNCLDEILTRAKDLGIRGHVGSVHSGTPGFKEEQGAHGHGCRLSYKLPECRRGKQIKMINFV